MDRGEDIQGGNAVCGEDIQEDNAVRGEDVAESSDKDREISTNMNSHISKPVKNMLFEYRLNVSDQWKKAQIHSRAGKAKGKYANNWNAIEDGDIKEVNLKNVLWRP